MRLTSEPEAQCPSYADYLESLNYRQPARREAEVRLQQQVEDPLRPLPVLGLRVLQLGIDDPEGAGERDADPTGDLGEPIFGFRTVGQVERRQCRQMIEDRLQLDLLVDVPKLVDTFLQALRDGRIKGLDDDAAVRFRGGLPAEQQIIDLPVHEVAVALQVRLIDVETRNQTEETLEFSDPHQRHQGTSHRNMISARNRDASGRSSP